MFPHFALDNFNNSRSLDSKTFTQFSIGPAFFPKRPDHKYVFIVQFAMAIIFALSQPWINSGRVSIATCSSPSKISVAHVHLMRTNAQMPRVYAYATMAFVEAMQSFWKRSFVVKFPTDAVSLRSMALNADSPITTIGMNDTFPIPATIQTPYRFHVSAVKAWNDNMFTEFYTFPKTHIDRFTRIVIWHAQPPWHGLSLADDARQPGQGQTVLPVANRKLAASPTCHRVALESSFLVTV